MAERKDTHLAEQEASSKRPPWWWGVGIAGLALVGMAVVIIYGYTTRPGWVGVSGKKFWDYLELLIVPAALVLGAWWLNRMQERERRAQEDRREREREAEAE
jgi:hypothetical protein